MAQAATAEVEEADTTAEPVWFDRGLRRVLLGFALAVTAVSVWAVVAGTQPTAAADCSTMLAPVRAELRDIRQWTAGTMNISTAGDALRAQVGATDEVLAALDLEGCPGARDGVNVTLSNLQGYADALDDCDLSCLADTTMGQLLSGIADEASRGMDAAIA